MRKKSSSSQLCPLPQASLVGKPPFPRDLFQAFLLVIAGGRSDFEVYLLEVSAAASRSPWSMMAAIPPHPSPNPRGTIFTLWAHLVPAISPKLNKSPQQWSVEGRASTNPRASGKPHRTPSLVSCPRLSNQDKNYFSAYSI